MTSSIPTPAYVVYEDRLRRNLQLIADVARRADVEIIMALKANALWRTFPILRPHVMGATASSVNEMTLAREYLTDNIHAFAPVYSAEDFRTFCQTCSHVTFNSMRQLQAHTPAIREMSEKEQKLPSFGLRVNPQCSVIETDIYNPCLPGSRFGMMADQLPETLPKEIEGFHFHALCESSSHDLEKVLGAFEHQFGRWLPQLKWLNLGGGHLMTRADYDRDHLVDVLRGFKERHPHLHIIMEPGSAFAWRSGDLIVTVLDVVENSGVSTAIIDASFACHMPDCLEMPYRPRITEALNDNVTGGYEYRLGGNSCLSGDYCGTWRFREPLQPGQRLTLEDMNHYTNVKTTMFNGLQHPSVYLMPNAASSALATEPASPTADTGTPCQGITGTGTPSPAPILLRTYTFADYRDRMC